MLFFSRPCRNFSDRRTICCRTATLGIAPGVFVPRTAQPEGARTSLHAVLQRRRVSHGRGSVVRAACHGGMRRPRRPQIVGGDGCRDRPPCRPSDRVAGRDAVISVRDGFVPCDFLKPDGRSAHRRIVRRDGSDRAMPPGSDARARWSGCRRPPPDAGAGRRPPPRTSRAAAPRRPGSPPPPRVRACSRRPAPAPRCRRRWSRARR